MFNADTLTFREFMLAEPLPLSTLHQAVLELLRGREDAVVCGAQAVNAYVGEARMSQGVDLVATRAADLVEELRQHLVERFHALRVRDVGSGRGFRLYQRQQPRNRHLVDVRAVEQLPASRRIAGVLVMAPVELVAAKIEACHHRRGRPKAGTDWRDLAHLLLEFPELREDPSRVEARLEASADPSGVVAAWRELVQQELRPEDEDEDF